MMDTLIVAWAMIGVVVLIVGIVISAIFLVMWVVKMIYIGNRKVLRV